WQPFLPFVRSFLAPNLPKGACFHHALGRRTSANISSAGGDMRSCVALVTVCCAYLVACSREIRSPEEAVRNFYAHLNAGEYSKAKGIYAQRVRDREPFVRQPMAGVFVKWANYETKQGSIDKIMMGQATTREDSGTVKFAILYRNGTSVCREAPVFK